MVSVINTETYPSLGYSNILKWSKFLLYNIYASNVLKNHRIWL